MATTKMYNSWRGMKERCNNPNNKEFKNYGERNIKVCKEWNSFKPFMEWALSSGYVEGLSIDRKDNNGNYEPSNCKWSTTAQQSRNKRTNHFITFNGETKIFKDWAKTVGITQSTLRDRFKFGWSVERALTTPKMASRIY